MEHTEKKLQTFRETVLKDAQQKKDQILDEIQKNRKESLSNAENEILNKAYNTIQREKTAIIRSKNERISKALADSKKVLLKERESILQNVFDSLYKRIDEYRKTEEYKNHVIELAQQGIRSVGDGEVIVYLDSRDKDLIQPVKEAANCNVDIDNMDILGGCRVINKTKKIISDNSLTERISEIKGSFLEETGLFI